MEEKEPRKRSTDAPFTAPEQASPQEARGQQRRRPAKAAPPPVTFQPPPGEPGAEPTPGTRAGNRDAAPRPSEAGRRKATPRKAPRPTPPPPAKATTTPTPTPAKATPKPAAAKTTPAQRAEKAAEPDDTAATSSPAAKRAAKTTPAKSARQAGPTTPAAIPEQQLPPADQPVEVAPAKRAKATPAKRTPRKASPARVIAASETNATEPTVSASAQPEPAKPTPQAAESTAPAAEPPSHTHAGGDGHPATEDSADPAAAREIDVPAPLPASIVAPEPPLRAAAAEAEAGAGATTPNPDTRTEPWARLVADPGHAPELLALAAVQSIGPRAAEWAQHLRERYPQAGRHGLARLAERQFLRFGGVGSAFAAVAGSYVPVALLASNAVTYAELILHVAAAYGQDPTDRRRAVELLVLTQVHATPEDAEEALAAAEQPPYEDDARLTDAVWRLGRMATAQAGAWALVRAVNRYFPGVTMLASVITSRSGVRTVAGRAATFYSQLSQDSGSRV